METIIKIQFQQPRKIKHLGIYLTNMLVQQNLQNAGETAQRKPK